MDLNIVRSGLEKIQEKVVYITLEADGYQYENSESNPKEIDAFMNSIGFQKVHHPNAEDPTYLNKRCETLQDTVYICQKM